MATLKRYHCHNPKCQGKDKGVFYTRTFNPPCPQCRIDLQDRRYPAIVRREVVIHFDPPSDIDGFGTGTRACMPDTSVAAPDVAAIGGSMPNPWHAATGNVKMVNCLDCLATAACKRVLTERDADGEEPIDKDKATLGRILRRSG